MVGWVVGSRKINISNNINSAIVSGNLGIQRASKGITQNISNLASVSAFSVPSGDPQEFLANATFKQLSSINQMLPETSDGVTSNLVGCLLIWPMHKLLQK